MRVRVRVRSAPILTDVLDVPAARHEHAVRLAVHLTRRADGGRHRLQARAQHRGCGAVRDAAHLALGAASLGIGRAAS